MKSTKTVASIKKSQQPVYVMCPKCHRDLPSSSKSRYSNPVTHISACIWKHLHDLVYKSREDDGLVNGKIERQLKLQEALSCKANSQDFALHTLVQLVCLHNTPLTKMNDRKFCEILSCDGLSYTTFINTLMELLFVVKEKIAGEMNGKKGTIMHDGWSKFSRHHVCLLVSYLVATGEKYVFGEEVMEGVNTLLTCTTLPHDDEEYSNDG